MSSKVLSGYDNIHNEAHYVVGQISIFFFEKMLSLFAASINISPLSGTKKIFGQGRSQKI